jgi:hypothetical protein
MKYAICIVLLLVTALTVSVAAQQSKPKPPGAADWAALAKLPDLTGVWEAPTVGRGGRGPAAAPPPEPQLTPAYAAKKRELDARNSTTRKRPTVCQRECRRSWAIPIRTNSS